MECVTFKCSFMRKEKTWFIALFKHNNPYCFASNQAKAIIIYISPM